LSNKIGVEIAFKGNNNSLKVTQYQNPVMNVKSNCVRPPQPKQAVRQLQIVIKRQQKEGI